MKTFRELNTELYVPKSPDEKRFVDKHVVKTIDHPLNDKETLNQTKKSPGKKKRLADFSKGEDEAVYEEMSDAQSKKREDIVNSMKDKTADLKKRYGSKWKSVMYATATKNAMKESVNLDEEMSPEDIKSDAQEAMNKFNSDMATTFPASQFTAKAMTSPMGGGISFLFAVIPLTKAKGADLENAPARSKFIMHLTDGGGKGVAMSKFSIEQIVGRLPVKFRKITGKSPTDAVNKMVAFFKKNKEAFTSLINEATELDEDYKEQQEKYHYDHLEQISRYQSLVQELGPNYNSKYDARSIEDMADRIENELEYQEEKAEKDIQYPSSMREFIELGELSKKTLGSYVKKAAESGAENKVRTARHNRSAMDAKTSEYADKKFADADSTHKKYKNRMSGIAKATDRLTKESTELEETFSVGNLKLKDGSIVKLNNEDANKLNALFNSLKGSNQEKMNSKVLESKKGFSEMLAFAKETV